MSNFSQYFGSISGGSDVPVGDFALEAVSSDAIIDDGTKIYIKTGTSVSGLTEDQISRIIAAGGGDYLLPFNVGGQVFNQDTSTSVSTSNNLVSDGSTKILATTTISTRMSVDSGVTWRLLQFPSDMTDYVVIRSVPVYFNSRFYILVERNSTSYLQLMSTDGTEDWVVEPDFVFTSNTRTAPLSSSMASLSVANGRLFVFYSYSNTGAIVSTADGVTWIAPTTFTYATYGNGVPRIVYGAGVYVLPQPAPSGNSLYSTDGITWSNVTGMTYYINEVIYTGSLFVAAGYNPLTALGSAYTSTDGITWTARALPGSPGTGRSLAVSGSNIVLGTGSGQIYTSTTGTTWTLQTSGMTGAITALLQAGSVLIATQAATTPYMRTSSDNGVTWTTPSTPGYNASYSYTNFINSARERIITSGSTVWAIDGVGSLSSSTDPAVTWTRVLDNGLVAVPTTNTASMNEQNGKLFIMPSAGGLQVLDTTTLGYRRVIDNTVLFKGVAYGNSIYVASSADGLYSSADGITWTKQTAGTIVFNAVYFGNGVFIAGTTDAVYRSTNGTTWSSIAIASYTVVDVVYGEIDNTWVLSNRSTTVCRKSLDNGLTWISFTNATGYSVRLQTAGGRIFAHTVNSGMQSYIFNSVISGFTVILNGYNNSASISDVTYSSSENMFYISRYNSSAAGMLWYSTPTDCVASWPSIPAVITPSTSLILSTVNVISQFGLGLTNSILTYGKGTYLLGTYSIATAVGNSTFVAANLTYIRPGGILTQYPAIVRPYMDSKVLIIYDGIYGISITRRLVIDSAYPRLRTAVYNLDTLLDSGTSIYRRVA